MNRLIPLYISMIALLWPYASQGQGEADQWWIGYHGSNDPRYGIMNVDFRNIDPVIIADPLIPYDTYGTNAVICAPDGQILLMTNGMQVFTKDFSYLIDTIAYGTLWEFWNSETGKGFPDYNGALFLPLPGSNDEYCILYNRGKSLADETVEILEARVRITQESAGEVIYKDEYIDNQTEDNFRIGISATKHANGRDWWVILMEDDSERYFRFLLDPSGIRLKGIDNSGALLINVGLNQVNFSPNGNYFARVDTYDGSVEQYISVFSFDRCTGKLNFIDSLPSDFSYFSGCAFSPSERYFYATENDALWQWDLQAENLRASKTLVDTNKWFTWPGWFAESFGSLNSGPDGRIYLMKASGSSHSMSVIDRPDEPAETCRFLQNSIILPTWTSRSPPNFANYRLGPIDGSDCDTLGINNFPVARWRWELQDSIDPFTIRFTDLSYFRPEEWHWDFDDGMSSDTSHPVHKYAEPGLYHVCLTVSNEYATDSMCRWVEVHDYTSADHAPVPDMFQVHPNPFDDYLEVTPSADGYFLYQFSLTDMHGREVITLPMTFPGRINLKPLPPGLYLLSLRDGTKLVYSSKVMKLE